MPAPIQNPLIVRAVQDLLRDKPDDAFGFYGNLEQGWAVLVARDGQIAAALLDIARQVASQMSAQVAHNSVEGAR